MRCAVPSRIEARINVANNDSLNLHVKNKILVTSIDDIKLWKKPSFQFDCLAVRSFVSIAGCDAFRNNPYAYVVYRGPEEDDEKNLRPSYLPYTTRFIAIVSYLNDGYEPYQLLLIIKDQLKNTVLALHSYEISWLLLRGRILKMLEMYTRWQSVKKFCFGLTYSDENPHICCGGKFNVLTKKVPKLSISESIPHVIFGLYEFIALSKRIKPKNLFSHFMIFIANDANFAQSRESVIIMFHNYCRATSFTFGRRLLVDR